MKQKQEITSLQELFDWIEKNSLCIITEKNKNFFYIATPLNTDVFIGIEDEDSLEDILYKTIKNLEDFDVDERFIDLWDKDLYSPSIFLRMLQEDEVRFQELADKLRKE
jgi:hypothetical protein